MIPGAFGASGRPITPGSADDARRRRTGWGIRAESRNRTDDIRITRAALCQLSYPGVRHECRETACSRTPARVSAAGQFEGEALPLGAGVGLPETAPPTLVTKLPKSVFPS